MKTTATIRKEFLKFFADNGHEVVESSSLVPFNDPTLLFTNAGMNQFKDVFLSKETRPYVTATTSQRCVRAGGKHNDLDNVGYTARHHTFFEMLGNFSFGDYFKEQAIKYSWEFLTSAKYLNLPKEKLWVTVYIDDTEAFDIWHKIIGLTPDRIIKIGDKKGEKFASDNFWQMGDTGPCGPCTEIFYDHGEHIWGGLPGSLEEEGDRFIEIWNLVFMQYNRLSDGTMQKLAKPSVDTGMGLERISAVLQHVNNNYDIDIFKNLIGEIATILHVEDLSNQSLKVIADHIRSCAYLIADGVIPSNEGRGYVLRRILRRAVRHGHLLNAKKPFFYKLVAKLIEVMAEAGNILKDKQAYIEKLLKIEEEQFNKTLDRGIVLLNEALMKVENKILPGNIAFQLYDTFGFPLDLTADVCREHNITIDEQAFDVEMQKQKQKSQAASKFALDYDDLIKIDAKTNYVGRELTESKGKIVAIFYNNQSVDCLSTDQEGMIILDTTPFFAEAGGQIGDNGFITSGLNEFFVKDVQKYGSAYAHIGQQKKGSLKVGDEIFSKIDAERRTKISLNHSGTHLLHAALRKLIGAHAEQKGSLVGENILRFDFANYEPLTKTQLIQVEDYINDYIRANYTSTTEITDLQTAIDKGAIALFGDRYEDIQRVRMVSTGPDSIELCGGVHVHNTGEIGFFKIIAEHGIATGIRRIEALTGETAVKWAQKQHRTVQTIAENLKSDEASIFEKILLLQDKHKKLEKELSVIKEQIAHQESSSLAKEAIEINNTKVVIKLLKGVNTTSLRIMIDEIKNQLKTGIVVLASSYDDTPLLIVGVTKDLTSKIKANELIKIIAIDIDGKGGGKLDMATAGGNNINGLQNALNHANRWLQENL